MNTRHHNLSDSIVSLRSAHHMTQLDLAQKLNYSDKAVSKWERGESVPDISTLIAIADLFGISLDRLVFGQEKSPSQAASTVPKKQKINHRILLLIIECGTILLAVFAYFLTHEILPSATFGWLYFINAVPVICIEELVFNSIWFNPRRNYLIVSLILWSILAAVHLTFLYFGNNIYLLYLTGIPGQIIILLTSRIHLSEHKTMLSR